MPKVSFKKTRRVSEQTDKQMLGNIATYLQTYQSDFRTGGEEYAMKKFTLAKKMYDKLRAKGVKDELLDRFEAEVLNPPEAEEFINNLVNNIVAGKDITEEITGAIEDKTDYTGKLFDALDNLENVAKKVIAIKAMISDLEEDKDFNEAADAFSEALKAITTKLSEKYNNQFNEN